MNEQMRKEFESWLYGDKNFALGADELAWSAWQASRAAIVVELPKYTPKAHRINATVAGIKIELKKQEYRTNERTNLPSKTKSHQRRAAAV